MGFLGVLPIASIHPVQFSSSFIGSFLHAIFFINCRGRFFRIGVIVSTKCLVVGVLCEIQKIGFSFRIPSNSWDKWNRSTAESLATRFLHEQKLSTMSQPAFTITKLNGTSVEIGRDQ